MLLRTSVVVAVALCLSGYLSAAPVWVRVATPNFELYTTAGDKAGRDAALHFEQIRAFFSQASPVKPPGDFPLRIVVFSSADEYRPYAPNQTSGAYFAGGPGRDYIVMRDASPESYAFAVHEYVHFVIRHSGLSLPLWLSEGWADVYSSMRRVKDGMAVGDLIPSRMRALEAARGQWFDQATLTSVQPGSRIYNEGDRTGLFYAQSWALVHMLFLAPEYREHFKDFLMALHRGAAFGEATNKAWGKSDSLVFADARAYFERKKLVGTVFQVGPPESKSGKAAEPQVSPQDDVDSRLLLADVQVALGRADLARIEYERLERLDPDRKDLQQSLGFLFISLQDNRKAKEHLAKAFALGLDDPQACYLLARVQIATGSSMSEAAVSLERAIANAPGYTDALLELGVIRSLLRQFEESKRALLAVTAITADKATSVYSTLANAYLQTGDLDTARAHLATARKYAKKPEETKVLDAQLALLEARAKSPFAPRAGEIVIRAEGMIDTVDCAAGQRIQFRPLAGGAPVLIDLPEPGSVEIMHRGSDPLRLECGPLTPLKVVLEFGMAAGVRQGSSGVLRYLQF